ncbi:MAG: hypothetical protein Tsb0021_12330 [Chlamydiales bacterium]
MNNFLERYSEDITSQNGEDGILRRVFEILEIKKGWCVEFGAWDGKRYSNTYNLIENYGWSGILIESHPVRFKDLLKTYEHRDSVVCLNAFVSFEGSSSLDRLLSETTIPNNFDLLSIDIDGNDYHIWDSIKEYHPKVVIIEYNHTIQNAVDFTQPKDMSLNQGSSLSALIRLGREKGYELIGTTTKNGIFVDRSLFHLFDIPDNSIDTMRLPSNEESYFFQLYDGTVMLRGNTKLLWNSTPIREDKLQVYPKALREFRPEGKVKKVLQKIWRYFYTRRVV